MTINKYFKYALSFILMSGLVACADQQAQQNQTDSSLASESSLALSVYKSPTCGCCVDWIEHVEARGFDATVHHPRVLNRIKEEHGVAPIYQSCHTAITEDGYVFEGHIPAKYIQQFLENPPAEALGLAVPAMPVGSPGMELGNRFRPYDVLLLTQDGNSQLFARVESFAEQY